MTRVGIMVCLLAATVLPPAARAEARQRKVKLELKLPRPQFVGTPKDLKSANLEAARKTHKRPPFYVPAGVENVALGKKVTGSDMEPIIGELKMLTDGDKEGEEGSYVELGPGKQHVQIDLGAAYALYAIVVWHFHNQARVYRDIIVQCSHEAGFSENVRTLFNNDHDNSAGMGAGKDKEYIETNQGRLIDPKGVTGRYLRLYSSGSTAGDMNHYVEIEVHGLPVSAQQAGKRPSRLAFVSSGKEQYRFDTGLLRGTLRRGGKSRGLSSVTHVPSGTRLDGSSGIFGHYRVFTTNKRYGHAAWDWPSTSKLTGDGAVQAHWPKAKDRPFELTAIYRWSGPATLDLTTTVKAQKDLPQFEAFLASYFNKSFPASSVYVEGSAKTVGKPSFQTTAKSAGIWQMFPRNRKLVPLIEDGRWKQPPNPVKWAIRENLAAPLGIRRGKNSGPAAILMAPAEDCFALSTPYEGEGHFSLYLSLFGRDVKAGQTATARSRLVIAKSPTEQQILGLYKEYVNGLTGALRGRRRSP